MQKRKMKKADKVRITAVILIFLANLLFLPFLLKLPEFMMKDFQSAPEQWLDYGFIEAIKDVFRDKDFRGIFLFMQLPVIGLLIFIGWDVDKFSKKNKIGDGVGGPDPSGNGEHGTSRWQNAKEMDKSCSVWYTNQKIEKGGIIFGMEKFSHSDKVWLNNDDQHTLIIGATRSGKSRKIILPSIWEIAKPSESMVIGDPKGELYIYSKEYLEKEGYKVISLNLREPLKGNRWNILDLVNKAVDDGNIPKATELAWDIANAITNQTPSTSSEPIWKNGEQSTIASLILLTAIESEFKFQRNMSTAYYLLAEYGQPLADESIPLLDYIRMLPPQHPAKSAFATASIAPYKTRASFFTSALADMKLFSDPTIGDMTSEQDHVIENIGIEKTAVFLIVPDEKTTRNIMATLYVDQVYESMVTLANKRGGRIPRRVNFILDEFGNLPAIPDFDKKLTVAGGRGVRFTIAIQDIQQIKKLYDKNAQTITGNCHNWLYLKTADMDTAKLLSEKTGKYTIDTENVSSSIQSKGHSRSRGINLSARALLMPDEILRWDTSENLVLPISDFPARYPLPDLSEWKANSDFGFIATGNIDHDKEYNRQIVEQRWNDIKERDIQKVQIWLPNLDTDEPVYRKPENVVTQLKPDDPPKNPDETADSNSSSSDDGGQEIDFGFEEDNEINFV